MKAITGLLCGLIFGVGLALSGMTDTAVVLGFLDVFGTWNPSLGFVLAGALLVTMIAFRFVLKMNKPVLNKKFSLPGSTVIDGRLVGGAALFGVGWGIYGYCPGPAISSLAYLDSNTFIFVAAMLVGMAVANRVSKN